MTLSFSTRAAQRQAEQGLLEEWIQHYLRAPGWANIEMADGLKLAPRLWRGPELVALNKLTRTCGPEIEMPYPMPADVWAHRTGKIAQTLDDPLNLSPLIIQELDGVLYVRDGNHRVEAARQAGWKDLWALIWVDKP